MDITIDKLKGIDALEKIFIKSSNENSAKVKLAISDSLDRLLKPAIETEFRLLSKNHADEEAIKVFSENLRQLLLASPLGSKKVLAIDPGEVVRHLEGLADFIGRQKGIAAELQQVADAEVPRVVDSAFGEQRAPLLVILLDPGVFVIDTQ